MNNEDYARHLCCSGCNNYVCYTNQKQCQTLKDLLTMAEWKDEQEVEFLQSLMFQSATYHIFDKINERIKLLKGE